MQSTELGPHIRRNMMLLLLTLEATLSTVSAVAVPLALGLLILSGQGLSWLMADSEHYSAPTVRSIHILAGTVLLASVLWLTSATVLRVAQRPGSKPAPKTAAKPGATFRSALALAHPASPPHANRAGQALALGVTWCVLGLLGLTGLERYGLLRHGVALLPGLQAATWSALHTTLVPYAYAALLFLFWMRGRIWMRRLLRYLYAP